MSFNSLPPFGGRKTQVNTHRKWLSTLGVLLLLFAIFPVGLTTRCFGDVYTLSDGRKIEGTIIRKIGDLVAIKKTDGTIVTIDRSLIVKTKKKKTVFDEYLERSKAANPKDANSQFQLSQWCKKQGLLPQMTLHLKRSITLDSNHAEARKQLGFIWIAGDWYLAGSPEAKERNKDSTRLVGKPKEIPEDYKPQKPPEMKPLPRVTKAVGTHTVQIMMNERVGKEPPSLSIARSKIHELLHGLNPRHGIAVLKKGDKPQDGLYMEVKVRVYFVRTHTFYNTPIANVFKGEAEAVLYEVKDGVKKPVLTQKKFSQPFSASVQHKKKVASNYCYYDTVDRLVAKLSRKGWFKKRGAKPYVIDEE